MQKATYYDSSASAALFGGYSSYPGSNGFGYEGAPQAPFPAAAHLEGDYQRAACSLQALGGAGPHAKAKELNGGSCMRPGLAPEPLPAPPGSPPPSAAPTSTSSGGGGKGGPPKGGPGASATLTKQIFPWMKESRQTSKLKSSSPGTGTGSLRFCPGPGMSLLF